MFRNECALDKTPLGKMNFQRGELTELLAKAVLYKEVETHWKQVCCNYLDLLWARDRTISTYLYSRSALELATSLLASLDGINVALALQEIALYPLLFLGADQAIQSQEEMTKMARKILL